MERDPVRGKDSFAAFEEVLLLAKQRKVSIPAPMIAVHVSVGKPHIFLFRPEKTVMLLLKRVFRWCLIIAASVPRIRYAPHVAVLANAPWCTCLQP